MIRIVKYFLLYYFPIFNEYFHLYDSSNSWISANNE